MHNHFRQQKYPRSKDQCCTVVLGDNTDCLASALKLKLRESDLEVTIRS